MNPFTCREADRCPLGSSAGIGSRGYLEARVPELFQRFVFLIVEDVVEMCQFPVSVLGIGCEGRFEDRFIAVFETVYCKLEIIQVADEKTPDKASEAEEQQIKDKEGKRILEQIKDGAFMIALAIDGKMLDSVELAEKIDKLGIGGVSQLVFVIGGSLGLSESVLSRADYRLSFSRMTFPHQLMRVILLEQIYRSYRIIHKEPYHK